MDPFRPDLLRGKTTVITGGGTGLGRSMALRLSGLGADVARAGAPAGAPAGDRGGDPRRRRPGGGRALRRARLRGRGARRSTRSRRSSGPVNQLVNNAAGNFLCASEDLSPNAFNSVVQIVLYGSVPLHARAGPAAHRAEAGGEILSIVTTYAQSGSAFVLPSAAAKAGVLAMMRSLAVEWAAYGIRLNAVAPGPFPTEGAFSRLMPGSELEKQALRAIPSRRFGEH